MKYVGPFSVNVIAQYKLLFFNVYFCVLIKVDYTERGAE